MYGPGGITDKKTLRNKVEGLLDQRNFVFKVLRLLYFVVCRTNYSHIQDPEGRTGFLRHPIIHAVVNKMWFKHKNDEGIIHPDVINENGIWLVSISLILAVASFLVYHVQPFTETLLIG